MKKTLLKTTVKTSVVVILISIYLYLCLCIFIKFPINSDMANLVLEANDIVDGNVFLSDWILTAISFLTTDMLFFVLASIYCGIHANTFYIAYVLMFVTFSLSSFLLFKWQNVKNNAINILIWFSIGALPLGVAPAVLSAHTAVWIYVFIVCVFIEKMFHNNLGVEIKHTYIIAVCLALGIAGDAIIVVGCIIPIFIVCIFYWLTDVKRSHVSVKLGITAAIGMFCGWLLDKLYFAFGGAYKNALLSNLNFKQMDNIPNSFSNYLRGLLGLFGADFTGNPVLNPFTMLYCLRFLLVIFGLYIVGMNIVSFLRRKNDDTVSVILSLGFLILSSVYIFTTVSVDILTSRYYAYAPILFSVLINRFFFRQQISFLLLFPKKIPARYCVFTLCALLIAGIISTKPMEKWTLMAAANPYTNLGNVLLENKLKNGFSGFWDASVTTVSTNNQCKIRAIGSDGTSVTPFYWGCKKIWYTTEYTNFIVIKDGYGGITEDNMRLVFGRPHQRLTVDAFIIYVYNRDISKELQGVK